MCIAGLKDPVKVVVPATVKAPVTSTASAIVTKLESDALKVVPLMVNAPAIIFPVPPGINSMSAFDDEDIVLSLNCKE